MNETPREAAIRLLQEAKNRPYSRESLTELAKVYAYIARSDAIREVGRG